MSTKDVLAQFIVALRRLIHVERVRGEPFTVQGRTFIPVSQSFHVGGLGTNGGGGFVWNRPVAITEEIGEGIYRHYQIRDETLRMLGIILISVTMFRIVLSVLFRRK